MFKKNELNWKEISILILIAYVFSFALRMIWIFQFQDNPNFYWNGQLMINTNDGYFFASAAEHLINGAHADNPRIPVALESYPAIIYATYFLTKFTPMSLETTILFLPAIISSLVVIPIVLTGQLVRLPWVGFFAALLGSIAWSYYNRTMTGYYDSDMFAVLLQFTILYLFLLTLYSKENKNILWLMLAILIYPFFYPQGLSLIYAVFLLWTAYQVLYQRKDQHTYLFIIMASVSLWAVPIWSKTVVLVLIFVFFEKIKNSLDTRKLFYLALLALGIFFFFGNVFSLIFEKIMIYTDRGVRESGLHFYEVIQTVREAGSISWQTVADRIIGGPILFLISIIGYLILVIRHKQFIIALPLLGIGVFAYWGGLRFTIYAVPMAAFSVIYLFYIISLEFIKYKKGAYVLFCVLSLGALYPNIAHIVDYKVPTVLNKAEVEDLTKLDAIADTKDYTLGWWDYGYPIWYYSDTNTLIDGGKHHNDNFIISKILQTSSPELAANLSRLAVETYVDSNYSEVADVLFKNGQKDQLEPNLLLAELEDPQYRLPPKTRDIYLYLPYRMMSIFPTVMLFGNLDLTTGKQEREIVFYPTRAVKNDNERVIFANGIEFDAKKGELFMGAEKREVRHFIITQNTNEGDIKLQSQSYHVEGMYVIIYMQSYGQFVIMDSQTFESTYVQMFILGKYDPNLFELVVSSPYSKIYKLKK
ncbi:MAG TPA: peptide-binding protein [Sulfurovum sp. UBA12169]|nr:MAG TPA: peptide-binding protein [Sulfurovum sp. UBA12169]